MNNKEKTTKNRKPSRGCWGELVDRWDYGFRPGCDTPRINYSVEFLLCAGFGGHIVR